MDLLAGSCSESRGCSQGPLRILPRRIVVLDPSGAPGQVPAGVSRWLAPALRSSVAWPKFDPVPSPPLCERSHRGSPLDRFEESKEVYRIRSKVVHGAQVHKNSETVAIYLVEHIVPQAERLARRCLAKVLELKIETIFENAAKLNTLFDKLLFSNSLKNALG